MSKLKAFLAAGALATGIGAAAPAVASVVIGGTRIIYEAGQPEVNVKLKNEGARPALTQAWIDTGDTKAAPGSIQVPFIVTPPVTRIDQGKGQTLRLMHTGEVMRQDRESVYWLNVLEIPPKDKDSQNLLQMAFRSRIKLFYRPAGLKGKADEAPAQVTWRLVRSGSGNAIEATNPTPYHVTFVEVDVVSGGKRATFTDGDMLAPGETKRLPLAGDIVRGANMEVMYRYLNDYGGAVKGTGALPPG
ncbi:fimbria/pilus periplasmic chaperone [Achromobacter spanius]|uniref:fimbria/pilus periplasmic chaperone n=1 Tax=Achromobacter spanius TaxID=217203 RepID=UPI00320812CA